MGVEKFKRPGATERRTLPPDAQSLVQMIRSVHGLLLEKAAHLKKTSHDLHARRGFQALFEQRAAAFGRLGELNPDLCLSLAHELGITKGVLP